MADKTKIGKYKIISVIGEGGMGKVYKAIHPTLKKPVIIKNMTLGAKKVFTERFMREARLMISFSNENIVSVYDHFREGSSYYIAMEYVDGLSLEDLIKKKKKIPPLAAVLIFREICKGLHYAHEKNVIHRDIKPDNVLISKNGEVKLVDFGIATSDAQEGKDLTRTGVMMGTPAFMSPEQIADAKHVDQRSDIYSMGVLFYQMVTGKKPFPSTFTAESINKIVKGIYIRPQKVVPDIPGVFKKIIRKTMHRKAKRRYKDLSHLIDILSQYTYRFKTQKVINSAIKQYIEESEKVESRFTKIKKKKKLLSIKNILIVSAIALVIGAVFFIYSRGFYHEILNNKSYGRLEVAVSVPLDYYKQADDLYVRVKLHCKDKNEEQQQEEQVQTVCDLKLTARGEGLIPINFGDQEQEEKKEIIFSTDVLYLPAGNYDLEVDFENQKYLNAFYLNPIALQMEKEATAEKRLILYNIKDTSARSIPVNLKVMDSETGKSIYNDVTIQIKSGNNWTDWKRSNKTLKTGATYSIKAESSIYYTKTIDFTLQKDTDDFSLDVSLVKKPGKLVIQSDYEGLEILIDNKTESYIGEMKKEFVHYGRTAKEEKIFMLGQGDYDVTIKKDDNNLKNVKVKITPGSTNKISVLYDSEKETITLK